MAINRILTFSNLVLFTALSLSAIAAWYSILGLMAIFAAAAIPIIIMGGSLEIAKVVTTVWLHRYWAMASWTIKSYLVPAVFALAFLTSMGIFGFLSKAHLDQGVPAGDVIAKVTIFDEKIKIAKDNIDVNRKALKQMDEAVDQVMGRSSDEKGADKAVQIRRGQQKERSRLLADIEAEQKKVSRLVEDRAPVAAEVRKVEAEVGPIKYIAALIYGDNPDSNTLERAVRWVIILIVCVFDPLALTLVIAANTSRIWERKIEEDKNTKNLIPPSIDLVIPAIPDLIDTVTDKPITEQAEEVFDSAPINEFDIAQHPYLFFKDKGFPEQSPEPQSKPDWPTEWQEEPEVEEVIVKESVSEPVISEPTVEPEIVITIPPVNIITDGVTTEKPYKEMQHGYVSFEGKHMHKNVLREIKPEFFKLTADSATKISTNFGIKFPQISSKGDIFVRVDALPNRVYKFSGSNWIEINKSQTDSYLQDEEYIQFLISKIDSGEYDIELLSENEKAQLEEFLKNQKT